MKSIVPQEGTLNNNLEDPYGNLQYFGQISPPEDSNVYQECTQMDLNAASMEMDELNTILNKDNERESSQRQQIYVLSKARIGKIPF